MLHEEMIKCRGDLVFTFTDQVTGKVRTYEEKNLIVTVGKSHIADQLADQGEAAMSHMAVGTGTTAAVVGNTTLEIELDRNALTSKVQGSGGNANQVTYSGEWAAGDGPGAITEAGIFNSASAGILLARAVFAVKNKGATDSLSIAWSLTISA